MTGASISTPPPTTKTPWNLVFAHHPLHTKGTSHGKIANCLREEVYSYRSTPTKGYGLGKALNEIGVQGYFSGHEHVSQYHKSGNVDSFVCGGVSKQGFYGGENEATVMDWADRSFRPSFAAVTVNAHEMVTTFVQADYSAEMGQYTAPKHTHTHTHTQLRGVQSSVPRAACCVLRAVCCVLRAACCALLQH